MIPKLNNKYLHVDLPELAHGVDVNDLLLRMQFILDAGNGIGLAANQIGSAKRVILINTPGFKQAIVNPVITKYFGGTCTSREGCLSFPGKTAIVVRHRKIIVEGFTPEWKPIRRKLGKLNAICVQHEVDYLNGITCIDKAT